MISIDFYWGFLFLSTVIFVSLCASELNVRSAVTLVLFASELNFRSAVTLVLFASERNYKSAAIFKSGFCIIVWTKILCEFSCRSTFDSTVIYAWEISYLCFESESWYLIGWSLLFEYMHRSLLWSIVISLSSSGLQVTVRELASLFKLLLYYFYPICCSVLQI